MKMPSSSAHCGGGGNTKQVWPPGFRFHPTDEELVLYYLKRKVCCRRLKLDIIAETDVYKWDPEDLPGQSKLKTGDRLWFFFSPKDRKYPNGGRSNRATHHGYWKATGKDRQITCNSRPVGLKKTLVFYTGRAPSGTRTDWVMHEYTLHEEELKRCKNVGDYYSLYKVYKKSGPGPKNGEQYGAPFKEEDWADEDCTEVGFDALEASIVSEPLDTLTTAVVRLDSDLNGSFDGNNGIQNTSNEVPILRQLQSTDFSNSFHQTFGDETQSTIFDPSGINSLSVEQGPCAYPASQQYNMGNSFDYSLSAPSQVVEARDINSGVITFDANLDELNKFLNDGDFLEASDLLAPQPYPFEDNPLANIQFDDTHDGLGEWELFDDASRFLHDTAANDVKSMFHGDYGTVNNLDYQLQPQSGVASFVTSEPWGHDNQNRNRPAGFLSAQHAAYLNGYLHQVDGFGRPFHGSINEGNQNSAVTTHQDSQNHNDTSRPHNRITSALWDFVESIPTTPASASENILFSRALERVTSFSRTRLSGRKSAVAAGTEDPVKDSSKSRSVLLFSIVGALCAMLWLFMTKTTVSFL